MDTLLGCPKLGRYALNTHVDENAVQRKELDGRNLLRRIANEFATARFALRPLFVPFDRVEFVAFGVVIADERHVLAADDAGRHVECETEGADAGWGCWNGQSVQMVMGNSKETKYAQIRVQ